MKVKDVLKSIEADGWYLVGTKGSHRQYKYSNKQCRVTVPGKPGDDHPRWAEHTAWILEHAQSISRKFQARIQLGAEEAAINVHQINVWGFET